MANTHFLGAFVYCGFVSESKMIEKRKFLNEILTRKVLADILIS